VLTALQSDSREDLQVLLEGYGTALTYKPTAADDVTQDPDVHGETAAESLNDTFEYGGPAGRDTSIVSEALIGQNPHDLSGLFKAQRDTLVKLTGHEAELQGLITNFNVTMGALATEQDNVSASFAELAPTLEQGEPTLRHLSEALPPLRALARVLEPSVEELPGTIRASGPWLDQANLLLRDSELGGLARLLADSAAPLARTSRAALKLFPELTNLGRCTSEVLEPTGSIVVNDGFSSGESNFHELFYGLTNLNGESAGFDGNGPFLRLNTGGGPVDQTSVSANPGGGTGNTKVFGRPIEFPDGVQPALPASGQPPFKMNVACHTNAVPDVNGPVGAVAAPDLTDATP
jgi:phospholipid/cholesterol/gamma-HCH transport system substrate-binding protein